ncbi:hypothetical protein T310_9464, partial [Rasamsonia emersonii CBS 393.64]
TGHAAVKAARVSQRFVSCLLQQLSLSHAVSSGARAVDFTDSEQQTAEDDISGDTDLGDSRALQQPCVLQRTSLSLAEAPISCSVLCAKKKREKVYS